MNIIIICIAVVVFMPLIAKVPLAFAMFKQGKYDNKHPRQQQSSLTGLGARAHAAHQNSFEAICYFAPTILLVLALDAQTIDTVTWSVAFVVLRSFYLFFYWFNWDIARSTVWVLSIATLIPHYWSVIS